MTAEEFFNLTQKMRDAQKAYYAFKPVEWTPKTKAEKQLLLIESKRLEKQVDNALINKE